MNSHFNSALKQTSSLTRDLALFSNPTTTTSPALQGQISASLASLTRTLDDYETLAKRELIPAKKEKAGTRLREFRAQLDEFRREFARVREEREVVVCSPPRGPVA
jgi:Golgi SNAP receptor complex protein 2